GTIDSGRPAKSQSMSIVNSGPSRYSCTTGSATYSTKNARSRGVLIMNAPTLPRPKRGFTNNGSVGSADSSPGRNDAAAAVPAADSVRHVAYLSLHTAVVAGGDTATSTPAARNAGAATANAVSSSSIVGTTRPTRSARQIARISST